MQVNFLYKLPSNQEDSFLIVIRYVQLSEPKGRLPFERIPPNGTKLCQKVILMENADVLKE